MTRAGRLALVALSGALLTATISGCAATAPTAGERMFSETSVPSAARPLTLSLGAAGAPEAPVPPALLPDSAGPDDYVRVALERSPALASARFRVEQARQQVTQVTSLEDPMLMVAPVGEMAETAAGMVGTMVEVSQTIPFPGKLSTAGDIARQQVRIALEELEQARLELIADVRSAYWSYYYTDQAIDTTEQTRALLEQFQSAAEARLRTGMAEQADVLRASVELSNVENELITLGQERANSIAMLNSLLDRPVDAPLPEPRSADAVEQTDLRIDVLLARAADANPELEQVRKRIEAERLRYELARLNRWPDLTVGANYSFVEDEGMAMDPTGDDQWWLSFGINLPIWQARRRAAEREALAARYEAIADLRAASNRVAFRTHEALTRVQTQQRLVMLFRDVLIPQAQQTVDASDSAYRAGRADFGELVDNWRELLNARLMYQQNVAELEKALAALEQTVGVSLAPNDTTDTDQDVDVEQSNDDRA